MAYYSMFSIGDMLTSVLTSTKKIEGSLKKLEGGWATMAQQQKKMLSELSELRGMVENLQKKGFVLKGSGYEVHSV